MGYVKIAGGNRELILIAQMMDRHDEQKWEAPAEVIALYEEYVEHRAEGGAEIVRDRHCRPICHIYFRF